MARVVSMVNKNFEGKSNNRPDLRKRLRNLSPQNAAAAALAFAELAFHASGSSGTDTAHTLEPGWHRLGADLRGTSSPAPRLDTNVDMDDDQAASAYYALCATLGDAEGAWKAAERAADAATDVPERYVRVITESVTRRQIEVVELLETLPPQASPIELLKAWLVDPLSDPATSREVRYLHERVDAIAQKNSLSLFGFREALYGWLEFGLADPTSKAMADIRLGTKLLEMALSNGFEFSIQSNQHLDRREDLIDHALDVFDAFRFNRLTLTCSVFGGKEMRATCPHRRGSNRPKCMHLGRPTTSPHWYYSSGPSARYVL